MSIFEERYKESMAAREVRVLKRFDPSEKRDKDGKWVKFGSLSDADKAKIVKGAPVTFYSPTLDRHVTGKVISANYEPHLHKIRTEGGKEGYGTHIVDENRIVHVHDPEGKDFRDMTDAEKQRAADIIHGTDTTNPGAKKWADHVEDDGGLFEIPDFQMEPTAKELERRAAKGGAKHELRRNMAARVRRVNARREIDAHSGEGGPGTPAYRGSTKRRENVGAGETPAQAAKRIQAQIAAHSAKPKLKMRRQHNADSAPERQKRDQLKEQLRDVQEEIDDWTTPAPGDRERINIGAARRKKKSLESAIKSLNASISSSS